MIPASQTHTGIEMGDPRSTQHPLNVPGIDYLFPKHNLVSFVRKSMSVPSALLSLICKWEIFQPAIGLPNTCWYMQERCPCRVSGSSPNVPLNQHCLSMAICFPPYPLFLSLSGWKIWHALQRGM